METLVEQFIELLQSLAPAGTMLSFEYSVRALLALVLISITCGAVGSLVVGSRMAFFSDALAHSAFAGVALGILGALILRLPRESVVEWATLVMVAFGVVVGVTIAFVRERTGQSSDTVIGVFFAGAIGLGAILLKIGSKFTRVPSDEFLFGSLAGVKTYYLLALAGQLVVTLAVLAWIYNGQVLASFNPSLARSRRVPQALYNYVFIALLAVIVNLCLSAVGALLINALLVVPAATASLICRNLRQLFRWSVLLCLGTSLVGLWLNWEVDIEVEPGSRVRPGEGGTIVVLNVLLYFAAMVLGPWLRRRSDRAAETAAPAAPAGPPARDLA
jgi:zinc transport system permease protein